MTLRRIWDLVLALVFLLFLIWYMTTQVVLRTHGYLTEEPPPHWEHSAFWMLLHMVGGITVLAIGPFQFWPQFRNRFPGVHRILGRTYLAASMISIVGLLVRVIPVSYFAVKPSLYLVTLLWLLSIVAAYLSIRAGDVVVHMSFMMRGYVFASYFLLARYFIPLFEGIFSPTDPQPFTLLATDFLCWMIPWIVLEIGLFVWRYRRIRRREPAMELL